MKVLFLGNHTVGVRAMHAIRAQACLVGVVAHPEDHEDGVRYESVHAEAVRLGLPVLRATGKSAELASFIRNCAPDLLWITDFRYLLSRQILALAPLGAINLHPSLLPAYRGRASINWAILRGETQLGLTAHVVDEGMDTGAIVGQRAYALDRSQDVGDALELLYPLYESLTAEVLTGLQKGSIVPRAQSATGASAFPRRKPEDGLIDWAQPALAVWNLIRAVAAPYPGAFTPCGAGALRIWKATGVRPLATTGVPPGEVVDVSADGRTLVVACGDSGLVVSKFEMEGAVWLPRISDRLGGENVSLAPVPHNRLTHGPEEEQAVAAVVRSGRWAGGAVVAELEARLARQAGVAHGVAVGSGIGALRLSLLALGVGAGDRVAVPAYSCVALANAVLACGAEPVSIEIEPGTWNISVAALRGALAEGFCLKAVIAVHTFGLPAPVRALEALGVPVIEDCSHAFGPAPLGGQTRLAMLSLYATKLLGAGEGGMVLTNDPRLADRIRRARDYSDQAPAASRLNDKMTDLTAALACCQLQRLPASLARREELAARYTAGLAGAADEAGFELPAAIAGRVWYRYTVAVSGVADEVIARLAAQGVTAARPVEPWSERTTTFSERAFRRLVSLPLYPTLTSEEQDRVIAAFLAAVATPVST